jgi:predicted NACHT family NTPase
VAPVGIGEKHLGILAGSDGDPIRFLGSQHNLFAGANKSLNSVYVRQKFKLEISEIDFRVEEPQLEALGKSISLSELKDINEHLKFAAAFVRNAQAWDSGDTAEAEALAEFLDRLPKRLSGAWEEQWHIHESEASKLGTSAVPNNAAKIRLPASQTIANSPEIDKFSKVLAAFARRVCKANEFVRVAKSRTITVNDLRSEKYFDFCRITDLMRTHPIAFRRITKTTSVNFSEDLLDKITSPVLVTAPAGHGKTSFCKWNTLNDVRRLIEKHASVSPIYVPLHRLSTTELGGFEDVFFRTSQAKELLTLAQKRGQKVRLYLDGLDEVSTIEQQQKLMVLASEIPTKYPFVQIVVTGRDYVSGVWLRWLSRVQLSELDDRQIRAFVTNWLDGNDEQLAAFYDQLAKTPALRPLMRIPLLGTLIIAVFKRMKSLPENKLKLYEAFTELMCGEWDLAKNVRRDARFGSNTKLSVLTRLAGQLHINGQRDAQAADVRSALQQTAPALKSKWAELLDEILEDGLLVRASSGTYIFSHLSFQEYLAATELTDPQGTRSSQALKEFLRGDDKGREVMTFYLSLIKRPDETEAWMKKTAEQVAEKGAEVKERYEFLMEQLTAAWPGWSPRKGSPRI